MKEQDVLNYLQPSTKIYIQNYKITNINQAVIYLKTYFETIFSIIEINKFDPKQILAKNDQQIASNLQTLKDLMMLSVFLSPLTLNDKCIFNNETWCSGKLNKIQTKIDVSAKLKKTIVDKIEINKKQIKIKKAMFYTKQWQKIYYELPQKYIQQYIQAKKAEQFQNKKNLKMKQLQNKKTSQKQIEILIGYCLNMFLSIITLFLITEIIPLIYPQISYLYGWFDVCAQIEIFEYMKIYFLCYILVKICSFKFFNISKERNNFKKTLKIICVQHLVAIVIFFILILLIFKFVSLGNFNNYEFCHILIKTGKKTHFTPSQIKNNFINEASSLTRQIQQNIMDKITTKTQNFYVYQGVNGIGKSVGTRLAINRILQKNQLKENKNKQILFFYLNYQPKKKNNLNSIKIQQSKNRKALQIQWQDLTSRVSLNLNLASQNEKTFLTFLQIIRSKYTIVIVMDEFNTVKNNKNVLNFVTDLSVAQRETANGKMIHLIIISSEQGTSAYLDQLDSAFRFKYQNSIKFKKTSKQQLQQKYNKLISKKKRSIQNFNKTESESKILQQVRSKIIQISYGFRQLQELFASTFRRKLNNNTYIQLLNDIQGRCRDLYDKISKVKTKTLCKIIQKTTQNIKLNRIQIIAISKLKSLNIFYSYNSFYSGVIQLCMIKYFQSSCENQFGKLTENQTQKSSNKKSVK